MASEGSLGSRLGENIPPAVPPAYCISYVHVREIMNGWEEGYKAKYVQYDEQKKEYLQRLDETEEQLSLYESLKIDYKIKLVELEKNCMLLLEEKTKMKELLLQKMAFLEDELEKPTEEPAEELAEEPTEEPAEQPAEVNIPEDRNEAEKQAEVPEERNEEVDVPRKSKRKKGN